MDRVSHSRDFLAFFLFFGILISSLNAIRVQTISEAKEELLLRQERAAAVGSTTSGPTPSTDGTGIFGNDTFFFNHSCILMETRGVGISIQELSKSTKSLHQAIMKGNATATADGSCENHNGNGTGIANLIVTFEQLSPALNISSASFRMDFTQDRFNWNLSNLTLSITFFDEVNRKMETLTDFPLDTRELFATQGTSYYCKEQSLFRQSLNNTQVTLYFIDLILEPFMNDTSLGFDPIENCEYAFGIGIWMGIVTALIMAIILGFGISMLASIRNMDRFDDPKTSKLLSVPSE